MKVGSKRKLASSPRFRQIPQIPVSPRSLVLNRDYASRDPQKLAYLKGCLSPKRSLSVAETWPSKRQGSIWVHEKRKEIHYNPVASCLSKLHSDPTFSIVLFSPLGPQTGSGAVPRTPATLRHSPLLQGRPRDALFSFPARLSY